MHKSSYLRMEWFVKTYLQKKNLKVLDIGSQDINGSYKELFTEHDYYGLDMVSGKNVDIVVNNPYHWNMIPIGSFDIVISGQAFEHTEFFWLTMQEIARVLKKGGLTCIIAPRKFAEHRYPVDCYRFLTDGMISIARYVSLDILHSHTNCAPVEASHAWQNPDAPDSIVIAKKNYFGPAKIIDISNYKCIPPDHNKLKGDLYFFKPDLKYLTIRFLNKLIHKFKVILKQLKQILWIKFVKNAVSQSLQHSIQQQILIYVIVINIMVCMGGYALFVALD